MQWAECSHTDKDNLQVVFFFNGLQGPLLYVTERYSRSKGYLGPKALRNSWERLSL